MKIVSSQSDDDIQRSVATAAVQEAVRMLAVNLLRVVRGAGKPEKVMAHAHAYAVAAQSFRDVHGRWPAEEIQETLDYTHDDTYWSKFEPFERTRADAIDVMVGGSLQVAASRLASQRAQESAGETQLMAGFGSLERLHEETRQQRLTEQSTRSPATSTKDRRRPRER